MGARRLGENAIISRGNPKMVQRKYRRASYISYLGLSYPSFSVLHPCLWFFLAPHQIVEAVQLQVTTVPCLGPATLPSQCDTSPSFSRSKLRRPLSRQWCSSFLEPLKNAKERGRVFSTSLPIHFPTSGVTHLKQRELETSIIARIRLWLFPQTSDRSSLEHVHFDRALHDATWQQKKTWPKGSILGIYTAKRGSGSTGKLTERSRVERMTISRPVASICGSLFLV
ncbi:hypothetical protein QBC44DRAFT_85021 [Cladorrhinum sp. PSN332]|nr:hypothetical protein QBC44DRAFT_85021 [Cladorrhinum sp. PSN332]